MHMKGYISYVMYVEIACRQSVNVSIKACVPRIYKYTYMCICICACMYLCMYTCTCICMSVCT